jgi:hypothetical protein
MSETFTFANLTNTAAHGLSTKTGIVEPNRQFENTDRVLVARALVTNSDEYRVPVRLLNVHNEVRSLRKGTFIAELKSIDEVLEVVNSVQKVDVSKELPDHLVDLFERSSQGMSMENKNSVLQLLLRYSKPFAKSDRDLGRTEIVNIQLTQVTMSLSSRQQEEYQYICKKR